MAKSNLALLAFVLALVSISASASATQQSIETAAPQTERDILVVGQRTREAIRSFVRQMAIAPRSQNQLARWDHRICPGVAGLRPRYAQFIIDRMAQRALDLDIDVGAPGCRANVLIIVSPDPDATAHELVAGNRRQMGYFGARNHATLGRTALAAFETSDAPVRWWHVNRTVSETGEEIWQPAGSAGAGVGHGSNNSMFGLWAALPIASMAGSTSRLTRATRQDLAAAFIIVDARRLENIHYDFAALADYLAMVVLAQLDPEAETSAYPTVLNLFAQPSQDTANTGMTDWDVAYLHGLYDAKRAAINTNQQQSEIAHNMNDALIPH